MTLDEHLRASYEIVYPIPDDVTPFQAWSGGYHAGLKDGQAILDQILETAREDSRSRGFDAGEAQGIAYCAYQASHTTTADINAAMTPAEAAAHMRDRITAALKFAADAAKQRMEAKA